MSFDIEKLHVTLLAVTQRVCAVFHHSTHVQPVTWALYTEYLYTALYQGIIKPVWSNSVNVKESSFYFRNVFLIWW